MSRDALLLIAPITLLGLHNWLLSRRIGRVERERTRALSIAPTLSRIWAAIHFVEERQAAEQTLMAAIAAVPGQKLYRREGRRYVEVDPTA